MTEYGVYPHPQQISTIDASFGREYDPYPDTRSRKTRQEPSWISGLGSPGGRTPAVAPLSLPASVPSVHRLTYQGSPHQGPAHTNVRSPRGNGPPLTMPGAAVFREHDQALGARWTNPPTNVSYPPSRGPSMMSPTQNSWRVDSSFSPRHASTPAPEPRHGELAPSLGGHYHEEHESALFPGGFPDGSSGLHGGQVTSPMKHEGQAYGRYGEPAPSPEEYIEDASAPYAAHGRYTQEPESYGDNSGYPQQQSERFDVDEMGHSDLDMEEELVPVDQSYGAGIVDQSYGARAVESQMEMEGDGHQQSPRGSFTVHEYHRDPERAREKGRSFTDRFRNMFSRKSSKSGSRQGTSSMMMPVPHPARPPLPRSQPSQANLARTSPSRSQAHLLNQSPRGSPSAQRRSPNRPTNPVLNTTADFSRSTGSSASSQGGPFTPDQTTDAPDDFPNPHEANGFPQPEPNIRSPEAAYIQPTADYDIMSEEPVYDDQPDYTFTSRINSIGKFFYDLAHLPFKTRETVTVTYFPGDSRRAQYAVQKPGKSWYAKEQHEKLDLLAAPTQIMRSPVQRPRAAMPRQSPAHQSPPQRARATQAPHPSRSPRPTASRSPPATKEASLDGTAAALRAHPAPTHFTTHGGLVRLPSPTHGAHGGSVQYLYASPQPLYLMPGTTPDGGGGGGGGALPAAMLPGSRAGSPGQGAAVPVYVLTTPGPLATVQVPGGAQKRTRRHHGSRSSAQRRHHHGERRSGSSTSSPPPIPSIPTIPRLDLLSS